MKDRKKVKKTVVKPIASAGDAEGGKEGLGGWDRQDPARPWPITRMGGRIVCASRHPPRHSKAGGSEALRPGQPKKKISYPQTKLLKSLIF